MNIYLCVKTHEKTNLKYLCKTTSSTPHLYSGSGKVWKEHLKEHGPCHSTEIIKICTSREELSYWGRYYSKLWRVVTAADDFGNKIWANLIPETGGGPGWKKGVLSHTKTPEFRKQRSESQRGSSNPKFDKTVYTFQHKLTGEIMHLTQYEFIKMSGAFHSNVSDLVNPNGRQKSVKNWIIK